MARSTLNKSPRTRILVHDTIYCRLRIGRTSHLDQSEAYDISYLVRENGPIARSALNK